MWLQLFRLPRSEQGKVTSLKDRRETAESAWCRSIPIEPRPSVQTHFILYNVILYHIVLAYISL